MRRLIKAWATPTKYPCCPGHDKWPDHHNPTRRSAQMWGVSRARENRYARRRARLELRKEVYNGPDHY